MALWQCSFEQCSRPAVLKYGYCILCDRRLCRLHLQDAWHKCPNPEDDWDSYSAKYAATENRQMKELSSKLNESALCARASSLRSGIRCRVDLSPAALSGMMGGQNCHTEICFDDNIRWIARFRLAKTASPPVEVRDYVLKSEAATMLYLQKHTSIPCPKIYDWSCESSKDNAIGVGYILMEKLEGKPLDWNTANTDQREMVMQQLADIFLEIEKHPFTAIGSIIAEPGNLDEFQIEGIARPATFRPGQGGPLGPFHNSKEAGKEIVARYISMIASGEIGGNDLVDIYLTHRFRLDVLQSLFGNDSTNEKFFLMHPDDKGDHIFINDSFEITGIVDWEWTQTVPRQLAFSSPCMMWPINDFYDGSNDLSKEELRFAEILKNKGRDDLANLLLTSRKVQRFYFFLGEDAYFTDRKIFEDLFKGLQRAFDATENGWEQWKVKALEKYSEEELLHLLLKEEGHIPKGP